MQGVFRGDLGIFRFMGVCGDGLTTKQCVTLSLSHLKAKVIFNQFLFICLLSPESYTIRDLQIK